MEKQSRYTYDGQPAELIRISISTRIAVYWIEVAGQVITTCLLDKRFRIRPRMRRGQAVAA